MSLYKVISGTAAERYGQELGAEIDLDLDEDTERAVIAAGWLDPVKKEKK